MKVWRSLCFNVCTFTNKSEFCFYLKKKCTQEFDFLGNFSRGKSRNVTSGYLSRWRSVPQTSPLERKAAVTVLPGVRTRCLQGRWRGREGGNETSKFNRDFFLFFLLLKMVSLTRNIGEKHSFFQLSLSGSFPIRNCAQAATMHFVIMTEKNEFPMCYLYQLQGACGSSVTRHSGGSEPELGWRASADNIIFG